MQRPEKRQAVGNPALPIVQEEEPQGGEDSDDSFSEEEEDEAKEDAPPAAPLPAAASGADAVPHAVAEAHPYGNPDAEALQLSLEEAFFLMYGMGVLSIVNEDGVRSQVPDHVLTQA